ncbi:LysR family transcriptional regulator [Mesobacillus zeae]|uniref:LysR family transcriptional regulator n=1 Tax=Mesobacillus zeae TaxID=1917180 RepID=A0A398B1D4_9BACI|nr:LysR family transcriptional regulator [Mesobacillus zeae]RID83572.1 LysR family transcriptional regulator [Mesobacillus zeae]
MNIHNLEAFVYAVHLGSFNKAAEALFLTQPSVTARIHSLENQMNTKLFFREGKHVSLTEKGKEFLPFAQNILFSFQEAKTKMEQNIVVPHKVRMGSATSIATCIMPDFIFKFKQEFPNAQISLSTGHSTEILKKVLNKEVDFALVRSIAHPNIESLLIKEDPIVLVAPPNHELLKKRATIRDVSRQPIVFFGYDSMDWLVIQNLFQADRLKLNVALEVDSMEAAKVLVKQGMGISFLPEHCVKKEIINGELGSVPLWPALNLTIKISLIHLKGQTISPFLGFFENLNLSK